MEVKQLPTEKTADILKDPFYKLTDYPWTHGRNPTKKLQKVREELQAALKVYQKLLRLARFTHQVLYASSAETNDFAVDSAINVLRSGVLHAEGVLQEALDFWKLNTCQDVIQKTIDYEVVVNQMKEQKEKNLNEENESDIENPK